MTIVMFAFVTLEKRIFIKPIFVLRCKSYDTMDVKILDDKPLFGPTAILQEPFMSLESCSPHASFAIVYNLVPTLRYLPKKLLKVYIHSSEVPQFYI